MKNLLFILGTRPEAIKLAPLILEFKNTQIYIMLLYAIQSNKKSFLIKL